MSYLSMSRRQEIISNDLTYREKMERLKGYETVGYKFTASDCSAYGGRLDEILIKYPSCLYDAGFLYFKNANECVMYILEM